MPRATSEPSTVNKPWVENYPALKEWLNKIGARCLEQVPGPKMAKSKHHTFYIEKWTCSSGREFYIEVRANRLGWNIYTPCSSSMITDTLRDAERRLKFTVSGLGAGVEAPRPVPPIEEASTTEALTAVLNAWCLREVREPISADDLILQEDLEPEQVKWLERFIDRWDEVEKAEVEAKKAAGASCT